MTGQGMLSTASAAAEDAVRTVRIPDALLRSATSDRRKRVGRV
jgi:hypothetical protein